MSLHHPKQKAVILDRDGTINVDKGYVYRKKDFEFIDGTIQAIRKLNSKGYKVLVITNQSGIARGFFREEDVTKLHRYINEELQKEGAHIDKFYVCPHHPNDLCFCRKPKLLLFLQAISDFDIDKKELSIIGDKESDILPAITLNCNFYRVSDSFSLKEIVDHILW